MPSLDDYIRCVPGMGCPVRELKRRTLAGLDGGGPEVMLEWGVFLTMLPAVFAARKGVAAAGYVGVEVGMGDHPGGGSSQAGSR